MMAVTLFRVHSMAMIRIAGMTVQYAATAKSIGRPCHITEKTSPMLML